MTEKVVKKNKGRVERGGEHSEFYLRDVVYAVLMLRHERVSHLSQSKQPRLRAWGGQCLIFKHLFWIFDGMNHPAVMSRH